MTKDEYKLKERIRRTRDAFPMTVEAVCLEITNIAEQIAPAIGEISIDEAKEALIKEFAKRMREPLIIMERNR